MCVFFFLKSVDVPHVLTFWRSFSSVGLFNGTLVSLFVEGFSTFAHFCGLHPQAWMNLKCLLLAIAEDLQPPFASFQRAPEVFCGLGFPMVFFFLFFLQGSSYFLKGGLQN